MAYGAAPMIEHGTSRTGRWLRERRKRLAFWIALLEGLLIVFHAISWWAAIFVAVLLIAFYFLAGHNFNSDTARQVSWIAAASQAIVALVPVFLIIVGGIAIAIVAIIAVLALVVLFAERR